MPGAFAHITLVNLVRSDNYLDSIDLNLKAKKALYRYLEYIELGSVSPDYPYLAITEKHKFWADCIHIICFFWLFYGSRCSSYKKCF